MYGHKLLKSIASLVAPDLYERLQVFSIIRNKFQELQSAPSFKNRRALWDSYISTLTDCHLTYIEFGVFEGNSIRYISERVTDKESAFYGLDSFQGLPENWEILPKGHFDKDGRVPDIGDKRVTFIKGWFQDSWPELRGKLSDVGRLAVHYDADLYSSTLFALGQIDGLKRNYTAIFDEFTGHEARALLNYIQAYNADVKFLGKTAGRDGYPETVIASIKPRNGR